MAKHKVTIQVKKRGGKPATVLRGASRWFPTRLLKLLFGGVTQVYLLAPGQTVEEVNIREIKEVQDEYPTLRAALHWGLHDRPLGGAGTHAVRERRSAFLLGSFTGRHGAFPPGRLVYGPIREGGCRPADLQSVYRPNGLSDQTGECAGAAALWRKDGMTFTALDDETGMCVGQRRKRKINPGNFRVA